MVGGPQISYDKAKEIKERRQDGETYDEIQDALNVSRNSISKYQDASEEALERLRGRDEEQETLHGESRSQNQSPGTTIRKISESRIEDLATEEYATILMYGRWVRDNAVEPADELAMAEIDLLKDALDFYLSRRWEVEKIEAQRDFFKKLSASLLNELRPGRRREKKLEHLRQLSAVAGMGGEDIPDEYYEEYMQTAMQV